MNTKGNKKLLNSDDIILSNNMSVPLRNNKVIVAGAAGSGTTNYYIKPNMLQMNASFVVIDPRGEIFYSIGNTLKNNGYKVKVLNLLDMSFSDYYNPLDYVKTEKDVKELIDCLFENTEGIRKDDKFFENCERLLLSACIFYLIDFCPDESKKNFSEVLNMISSVQVDELNPNAKSPLDLLFDKCPKDSLTWKYYSAFKKAGTSIADKIIASCSIILYPFKTKSFAELTKKDTLEIEKFKDEKTALFIISSMSKTEFNFIIPVLYLQILNMYNIRQTQSSSSDIPIHLFMNNFMNCGKIPNLLYYLANGQDISISIILQDISQLETIYPNAWKEIMDGFENLVFFGPTNETITDFLKNKMKNRNKFYNLFSKNSFVVPAEKCVVCKRNQKPKIDKKYDYTKHPYFENTGDYDTKNSCNYKEKH